MRKLVVEVVADTSQLVKGFKAAEKSTETLGAQIRTLDIDTKALARTQVAAAVRSSDRLRQEAAAYRELASAAERGSREQIAAARLATQAEKRLAASIAVTSREAKELGHRSREFDRFGRGALAGSRAFGTFGRSIAFASTSFLSGAGLVAALKGSAAAASDLNEQMSKTNVVFGASAGQVKAWSQSTTEAFGLSRREAVATASSFGALFKPLGIAGEQAAQQSERLTELGADLASFYNTDVASALDAIRSGILGEAEPLRQYGVVLSETRVQQEALRETGKKHVQALTAQEKALARIKIIFDDTGQAQGDFARTSEGLANQTRTLTGNIDDLQVKIGEKLVPKLTDATTHANEFFDAMNQPATQTSFEAGVDSLLRAGQKFAGFINPLDPTQPFGQFVLGVKTVGAIRQRFFGPDAAARLEGPAGGMGAEAAAKAAHGLALVAANAAAAGKAEDDAFRATAGQRNTWFDQMISRMQLRADLLPTLTGQIAALRQVQAKLQQRFEITKDITRRQNLEDQLLQGAAAIAGLQAARSDAVKAAAEAAKAAAKERADAAQAAAQAARAEALAWADFAIERAGVTKTLADDLKASQVKLKLLEKQAGVGKKTAEQARAIWEQQQDVTRIRKEIARDERGGTRFRPVNAENFVQSLGLNLNRQQLGRLTAAVAQLGPGATMPVHRPQAFALAGGATINIEHFHSAAPNAKQLQNELVRHAKSQPQPRRGAR